MLEIGERERERGTLENWLEHERERTKLENWLEHVIGILSKI